MLRSKLSLWREYLTPINNTLNFDEKGELSPDEFIAAGDFLVAKFPTWQWGLLPPQLQKPFLPPDKQFLVTRKVPLVQRASALTEVHFDENGDDDDDIIQVAAPQLTANAVNDEIADMEALMNANDDDLADFDDMEIVNNDSKLRKYDMYITYLTLYRVPKMYLVGYGGDGVPLTPQQMFEDINADYRDKTLTIEKLPVATATTLVLIHPCKHANVMRVMMAHAKESGGVRADHYLVVFLKFIASVCPGIDYDYTMDALA